MKGIKGWMRMANPPKGHRPNPGRPGAIRAESPACPRSLRKQMSRWLAGGQPANAPLRMSRAQT